MPAPSTPSRALSGKRILVGVSAGIAAFKAVSVVRALAEDGASVQVVPTPASLEFVGAATWEALSHNPVLTSVFEKVDEVAHVRIGHEADAVLVVPATADFLARARMGRADDLLTASLLMARGPVLVAPAMHTEMWEHPATRENVEVLRSRGVHVIEPDSGRLTGADSGKGRLPHPQVIADAVRSALAPGTLERDLEGLHVVITAGGTQEALDPVRVLTNRSSGRQGYALAHAALLRGARVTLITARADIEPPTGVELVRVVSARDMANAVQAHTHADVLVMAAAVSDFTLDAEAAKMKKHDGQDSLNLTLRTTVDILRTTVDARERGNRAPGIIVGFAAETGDEHRSAREHAQDKARRKRADLLVFNDVSTHPFGSADNAVLILDAEGREIGRGEGSKDRVAHAILDHVSQLGN